MKAEIAYYRAHLAQGRDRAGLAALRRACAEALRDALARPDLDLGVLTDTLLAAIRFEPFPDTVPALEALRGAGIRSSRPRTGTSRCTSSWPPRG